jgi:hypothetical protein
VATLLNNQVHGGKSKFARDGRHTDETYGMKLNNDMAVLMCTDGTASMELGAGKTNISRSSATRRQREYLQARILSR